MDHEAEELISLESLESDALTEPLVVPGDEDGADLELTGAVAGVDFLASVRPTSYSADLFAVIVKPITLTMALACLVAVNFRTPSDAAEISAGMASYSVLKEKPTESLGITVLKDIVNAAVLCVGIGIMTFGIVLLYYWRCMKCLMGLLCMSVCSSLSFTFGYMLVVGIDRFKVVVDWPTFVFLLYNFAIGGACSIFFGRMVTPWVTQGYLVTISIIMAWLLSFFSNTLTWILLLALSLYDLCAVLTPCGPLALLIRVAQSRPAGEMLPALLYEANTNGGGGVGGGMAPRRGGGGGGGGYGAASAGRAAYAPPALGRAEAGSESDDDDGAEERSSSGGSAESAAAAGSGGSISSGGGGGGGDGSGGSDEPLTPTMARVLEFYSEHNPQKATPEEARRVTLMYPGRERLLFTRLRQKYLGEPVGERAGDGEDDGGEEGEYEDDGGSSIKLGLGDFVRFKK